MKRRVEFVVQAAALASGVRGPLDGARGGGGGVVGLAQPPTALGY